MKSAALVLALAIAGTAHAEGIPECKIRVLRPVTDDIGNHWPIGKVLPVTIMRRDTNGLSFCAHGGSCVPRMVGGQQTAALVNCRPGASIGNGDYSLVPDPAVMGAEGARRFRSADAVGNRLAALGFSNASIAGWSQTYVLHPTSPKGRLVEQALAGSKAAVSKMKAMMP